MFIFKCKQSGLFRYWGKIADLHYTGKEQQLQVSQWVAPSIQYIVLDVHPKGHKQVKYNRGAHREERHVDKVFTNGGSCNAHPLANSRTNPEHMPFDEIL
jgi:hypothetical protein